MGSGWVATRKSPEAEATGQVCFEITAERLNFAETNTKQYMNENTRNIITTIATIIAIVCAVLNCILTAISLCAAN